MELEDGIPGGEKKYELIPDQQMIVAGTTLYRIRALKEFGNVKVGDVGGFVGSERNLSQYGNCWVADDARVYDEALVSGDARVFGRARIYGQARVSDKGQVLGNAQVFGNGWVFKSAVVFDNAMVYGHAQVRDHGLVFGEARICDYVRILGAGQVCGDAEVQGETVIGGLEEGRRRQRPWQGPSRGRGRPRSPRGPRP